MEIRRNAGVINGLVCKTSIHGFESRFLLNHKTINKDFDMSFSRMTHVTLVTNDKQQREVSFSVNEMRMNYSENSCTFTFDNDEDARNIEHLLQMNNVKTSHTDKCIYIKNFAEYDFRIG